jgi:Uncharacterized Rossmann fold enzyme
MTLPDIMERWDGVLYSLNNFAISINYYLHYNSINKILYKNKELKGCHTGERCFIVMNGPSINNHDLSKIKDEFVFASNYFFRAQQCKMVNPNYYCWLDARELNTDDAEVLISEIKEACPNAKLLLNAKAASKLGENEDIYYVYSKHIANVYGIRYNLAGISSNFLTVAFLAAISALYMGFKEIYFLGLDFEPNGFTHFTKLGENSECVKPGEEFGKIEVAGHYWGYTLAQYQSYTLEKLSRKLKCNIYNLNPNSYIRAFEFTEYEKLFNKGERKRL